MSTDNHCTSPEIADLLEKFNGGPVGCDPCTNARSVIRSRRSYTSGALVLPWGSGRPDDRDAYENPPYSQMGAFTDRGIVQMQGTRHRARGINGEHAGYHGPLLELTRLVMATPSTAWWRRAIGEDPVVVTTPRSIVSYYAPRPAIIFTKRLPFIAEDGRLQDGARFDSALFFYESSCQGQPYDDRIEPSRRRAERIAAFFETFAPVARWCVDTASNHGPAKAPVRERRHG